MSQIEIERVLRMARAYAAERLPWFAPALFGAKLILSRQCPIAAIDEGMRIYFNPERIARLVAQKDLKEALKEVGFLWVHEISHFLRRHGERACEKGAQDLLWNAGADLEINDAKWDGLKAPDLFPPLLPSGFCLPEGKLAEFYYVELGRKGIEIKATLMWDEGSGVHGQKRVWELPENSPKAPALTKLERELLRQSVAEKIVCMKGRGDIPLGWLRWAEEALKPKVDWRVLLKRRVRGAIAKGKGKRVDYTFHRPHRKADSYAPFLPPSLQGDFLPRVACVVDTSGSISQKELEQGLSEVREVLRSLRTPITVIPCDAVPYEPIKVFTQSDLLKLHQLPGGGGTDMVAGIEAALGLQPPPDAVIVLTDGYTPFPSSTYKVPVIFGIFDLADKGVVPMPPIPPWRKEDVIVISAGQ